MSHSNCCFLTWIQVSQETGKVFWYSSLFKNFPQYAVIHTAKGFGVVNEPQLDIFLELPCFLHIPTNVGNLTSGSFVFSKPSLNIWKFPVHVILKTNLKDFEHNLTMMGDECNCPVVWIFVSIALLGNRDTYWPFSVLWPQLGFSNLLTHWVKHVNSIIF